MTRTYLNVKIIVPHWRSQLWLFDTFHNDNINFSKHIVNKRFVQNLVIKQMILYKWE